jgi:Bacteriophage tail sheath protein
MPATVYRRTPGVYVTELAAFPPSIVGVQTAVPAFIGYTKKAEIAGKPVFRKAIRIGSMADFETIFGGGYQPLYDIEPASGSPLDTDDYDFKVLDNSSPQEWQYYRLVDSSTQAPVTLGALAADGSDVEALPRYNLYNSMRLFYANGGGNCYVVSVGDYQQAIEADALSTGLDVIRDQSGPTMLLIPDAVLLPPEGSNAPQAYWDLMNKMIDQAGELQDRVAILDVYGSQTVVDQTTLDEVTNEVREKIHSPYLSYGMVYFPFLDTSVVQASEINYQNIAPGTFSTLTEVLSWQNDDLYFGTSRHQAVQDNIDKMEPLASFTTPEEKAANDAEVKKINQNLVAALPLLGDIEKVILAKNQTLPPSGAMAGVYTLTDTTRGVWNAPANIALTSVVKPTYKLTGAQQGDLNVPIDGKAIDAIRQFTGRGTVVWGARTLDGNSNDYRYIQVRRTLIYIEQSIKQALDQFVFAANDGNTWSTVVAMVSSFLQGVWSQGGLMGATAAEAFSVNCGLGSTMTAQDILEGYMRVQVLLQMIRPAEFIELTFKQKLEGAG